MVVLVGAALLGNACSDDAGRVDFDPIGGASGKGGGSAGSSNGGTDSNGGKNTTAGSGGTSSQAGTTDPGGGKSGAGDGGALNLGGAGDSGAAGMDGGSAGAAGLGGGSAGATDGGAGGSAGDGGAGDGGGGSAGGGMGGGGMAGGGMGGSTTCTPTPEVCDGIDNDCDHLVDQGQTCPPDCAGASYGGHRYLFCSTVEPAQQALMRCQDLGLGPVLIGAAEENTFIFGKIKGATWIGATDSAFEKRWLWYGTDEVFWDDGPVDGKFSFWDLGEPEGIPSASEKDCAGMSKTSGKWSALNCGQPGYRTACEELDVLP